MLIPSLSNNQIIALASLSRRVNANSQPHANQAQADTKLIKKGEC